MFKQTDEAVKRKVMKYVVDSYWVIFYSNRPEEDNEYVTFDSYNEAIKYVNELKQKYNMTDYGTRYESKDTFTVGNYKTDYEIRVMPFEGHLEEKEEIK